MGLNPQISVLPLSLEMGRGGGEECGIITLKIVEFDLKKIIQHFGNTKRKQQSNETFIIQIVQN